MTPQELFTQAKNLLRKIDTNEMSPDSKALYDKGMEYLDAIPEPGGGPETEETPDEDTVQPDEGTEGEEGEPQEIAPEGAESTVDSVMEEQLEEATEKALKDKPE
jgi:hypothetical protein